jgi:hypothetical protein
VAGFEVVAGGEGRHVGCAASATAWGPGEDVVDEVATEVERGTEAAGAVDAVKLGEDAARAKHCARGRG